MHEFLDSFYPLILDISHTELTRSRTIVKSQNEAYFFILTAGAAAWRSMTSPAR